jgi:hypothetical protein
MVKRQDRNIQRDTGAACVPACIEAPPVYPFGPVETMAVIQCVHGLQGVRAEGTGHLSPSSYAFFSRKETVVGWEGSGSGHVAVDAAQPPLFDNRSGWLQL